MSIFLEYALKYAELGWKIFPLVPGQKTPITSHGVKDATLTESVIREWWAKWPDANIAVACGQESGIYVIDVDIDVEKGINGFKSLEEFQPLLGTVFQRTPRGGCHAFYQTDDPPANKNNFRLGIDIRGDGYYVVLTPSIHPNGGVYIWEHGLSPWECDIAKFPDSMRPVKKVATQADLSEACKKLVLKPPPPPPDLIINNDDIFRRASIYMTHCDPAVQGQAGHDKLFWAAQCLVNGFCLTNGQAFSILSSEYNPRCSPPWDLSNHSENKDFCRKISEARANPPRDKVVGWLLADQAYASVDLTEVRKNVGDLLAQMEGEAGKNVVELACDEQVSGLLWYNNELEFLTKPTGFLGELCSWINATSRRLQPLLTLGCSITFLGTLFGRKVRDSGGGRTNLYCMGVGESSSGKGHAPYQIRRLCESSNCLDLIGGVNITGDSAIEERLSNNPATIFFWDEIGHLLSDFKNGQHKSLVVPTLMSLYSTAGSVYLGREYADNEKQRRIVQPCCCIWGTTTPDRLFGGISPEELRDGWLGRVLTFQTKTKPNKKRDYIEKPVPEQLIEMCLAWMGKGKKVLNGNDLSGFATASFSEAPPPQIIVPHTKEAEHIFVTFDKESDAHGNESDEMSYIWAKAEEQARRVALIVATSEDSREIKIDNKIADYACRLIRFLIFNFSKTILPEIAGSELERYKRRIVSVIRSFGKKGCKKGQLTRKTQWTGKQGRESMLYDLIEAGEIACRKNGTTMCFWTPEEFCKAAKGTI